MLRDFHGNAMEYKVEGTVLKEMVVEKSCPDVTVTLNHTGNLPEVAMGHNCVIAETAEMQGDLVVRQAPRGGHDEARLTRAEAIPSHRVRR